MASCITGPYDPVHRPRVSDSIDYEGELGIVISRSCRHVPRDRALAVVAGYVVVNDRTGRDWGTQTPQVGVPKSFAKRQSGVLEKSVSVRLDLGRDVD